jgi:hypothetical protein
VEELELRLTPSNFLVTDTSDNAADPGSLRHAILQANSAGSGTILFSIPPGQNTITLENTAAYPNGFLYPAGPTAFVVTGDVTIDGSGQLIQRDASAANFRLFFVAPGAHLTLDDLQLSGGVAQGRNGGLGDSFGGAGGGAAGLGGAIFVEQGTLTLTACTLNGNKAIGGSGGNATGGAGQGGAGGGGLSGAGGIGHRRSGGPGGGPYGGAGGSGAQDGSGGGFGGGGGGAGSSAFGGRGGFGGGGGGGGNTSGFGGDGGFGGGGGGGGSFFGSGGVGGFGGGHGGQGRSGSGGGGGAGFGGGIFVDHGTLSITNSTLTGNTAHGGLGGTGGIGGGTGTGGYGYGGAIFNVNGNVTLKYDTIAFNTAGSGGAVYDLSFLDSSGHFTVTTAAVALTDSILSNSTASDLVVDERGFGGTATVTATMNGSNPTNIVTSVNIDSGSVDGSFVTTDPALSSSLSTKAGFAPLLEFTSLSSPAINPGGIPIGTTTDQWSQPRLGTAPTIGAFEPPIATVTVSTTSLTLGTTTQGTAGSVQTFIVSGSDLSADILVSPSSAGVELSDDGGATYLDSLDLVESGGSVAPTTIDVRIAAATTAGPLVGSIFVTSTGVVEQDIGFTGTVAPTPERVPPRKAPSPPGRPTPDGDSFSLVRAATPLSPGVQAPVTLPPQGPSPNGLAPPLIGLASGTEISQRRDGLMWSGVAGSAFTTPWDTLGPDEEFAAAGAESQRTPRSLIAVG